MVIVEGLVLGLLYLAFMTAVGWYIITPLAYWVADKYFDATVKAMHRRDHSKPPFQPTA